MIGCGNELVIFVSIVERTVAAYTNCLKSLNTIALYCFLNYTQLWRSLNDFNYVYININVNCAAPSNCFRIILSLSNINFELLKMWRYLVIDF